jgi:hypothetical protein
LDLLCHRDDEEDEKDAVPRSALSNEAPQGRT